MWKFTKKTQIDLIALAKLIKKEKIENLFVVSETNKIYHCSGNENHITIPDDICLFNTTLIHNHPSSLQLYCSPPSLADIKTMIFNYIKESWIVNKDKIYIIKNKVIDDYSKYKILAYYGYEYNFKLSINDAKKKIAEESFIRNTSTIKCVEKLFKRIEELIMKETNLFECKTIII